MNSLKLLHDLQDQAFESCSYKDTMQYVQDNVHDAIDRVFPAFIDHPRFIVVMWPSFVWPPINDQPLGDIVGWTHPTEANSEKMGLTKTKNLICDGTGTVETITKALTMHIVSYLANPDMRYAQYVPIYANRVINSHTFEQFLKLTTRFDTRLKNDS